MLFVTVCAGTEIRIQEADNTVVTMWGGTEILLPTLAEKMLRAKESKSAQSPRLLVVTFMGATAFMSPTLAQEIESLRELKDSGALTREEMIDLWREVVGQNDLDFAETITFMGASGREQPSKQKELKDLQRIASKGLLTAEEYQGIKSIIEGYTIPVLQNESIQEKLRALVLPEPVPDPPRLSSNIYSLPQR